MVGLLNQKPYEFTQLTRDEELIRGYGRHSSVQVILHDNLGLESIAEQEMSGAGEESTRSDGDRTTELSTSHSVVQVDSVKGVYSLNLIDGKVFVKVIYIHT